MYVYVFIIGFVVAQTPTIEKDGLPSAYMDLASQEQTDKPHLLSSAAGCATLSSPCLQPRLEAT